jgi:hypothetical protein
LSRSDIEAHQRASGRNGRPTHSIIIPQKNEYNSSVITSQAILSLVIFSIQLLIFMILNNCISFLVQCIFIICIFCVVI